MDTYKILIPRIDEVTEKTLFQMLDEEGDDDVEQTDLDEDKDI